MYLSHKYKFLFLRTPKTASSSLSDFFIRNIDDPDAIYTEVEDSNLPGTLDESIVSKYRPYAFYHFTLDQLIAEGVITEQQAREYNCFALLRDPVDRSKSLYYFYKKFISPNYPDSLEEYKAWTGSTGVFRNDPNSGIQQTSLLKIKGEPVGRYWLYEDLEKELFDLMYNLKIGINHPLPKHKTDTRKHRNSEIEFDEASLEIIKTAFKEDFELYEKLKHGNTK